MNTIKLIEQALIEKFQPMYLEVIDDRADHIGHAHQDSGHFTVIIKSPIFTGKKSVEQHRMVYTALGSLMQTHIHALRIQIQ